MNIDHGWLWDVCEKMGIFGNGKNCHFVGNANVANFCDMMDIFKKLYLQMNVKFSKGHLTPTKPKSEDIKKSISRMKKW